MTISKQLPPLIAVIACSAILILGLTGILIYTKKQLDVQREQVARLEQEKEADYFEKKMECEKYTKEVKREIDENNQSEFFLRIKSLEKLFYSPKENSCLHVVSAVGRNAGREGGAGREYFIYNTLTKSRVTSFRFPEQFEDYKKFILEYSGGEIRL